jgi:hypothetical protein
MSLALNHFYYSYDKLKPYGFGIHGCIDGYSRRILWLQVNPSNNNPSYVALYYMKCVQELKGIIILCICCYDIKVQWPELLITIYRKQFVVEFTLKLLSEFL